jgi:acyl dehydratase
MQLDSQLVGTTLKPHRLQVKWRRLMNYAAAVSDPNPVYFDDERPGGIIGHPMFCTAVTWRICERLWEFLETDRFPLEALATQVHYSEHLQFHRPIRAAEDLTVRGRVAAVVPHRSGVHFVIRFDAADNNGRPVFTEHTGALLRGVQCSNNGLGTGITTVSPADDSAEAMSWQAELPIDPLLPYIYDGCTDIHFPIHTSRRFAHEAGLPGIIVQGTATLALAVRELINRETGGNPLKLRSVQCRFGAMVLPGGRVRVQRLGDRSRPGGREIHFQVLNEQNEAAIRRGAALFEAG